MKLLLANGAEVNRSDNRSDNNGFTPLFIAKSYGFSEAVDLLKKQGAREIPEGEAKILRKKLRMVNVKANFGDLNKESKRGRS